MKEMWKAPLLEELDVSMTHYGWEERAKEGGIYEEDLVTGVKEYFPVFKPFDS